MKRKSNKNSFTGCAKAYIRSLQEEGRYSTAHVYKNAILSFAKFCDTPEVTFGQINRDSLRRYGQYLYDCGLKPNTVSTYMRMLRSIYNRGVEAGTARFIPRLFRDVFTGVDVRQKKALTHQRTAYVALQSPQVQPSASHTSDSTTDVSALRYAVCRLRTSGKIGIGTRSTEI